MPPKRSLLLVPLLGALLLAACDDEVAPQGASDEAPVDAPEEEDAADDPNGDDGAEDAEPDPEDADVAARFEEIVDQVAELRGLPVDGDIPFEVVSSEEITEIALADAEDDLEEIARSETVAKALHQIPEDTDLLELNEDLVEAGVAGMYVPEDDQAYVVSDGDGLSPLEQVTVAHEVVHALQDQYIDLGILDGFEDDPDAAMAFSSVIEGDAVRLQEQWATAHLTEEQQQQRQVEERQVAQEQQDTLLSLPRALLESFVAPYVAGPQFVGTITQDGDLDALDAALEDPPTTMVEIYDPSLYVDGFEPEPVEVGAAPDGYEPLASWTWGAFEVALLLELADGHSSTPELPGAWRGGQLEAFEDGDDVAVAIGWTFADEDAAAQVCEVVPDWHATVADSEPAGSADAYEGPSDALVVDCDGTDVSFAVAPDVEVARAALGG